MKKTLIALLFLLVQPTFGQSYDEQIGKAGEALQKKDFCNALSIFKTAFRDSTKIGTYEFAFAALSASNCNDEKQAFIWLNKSKELGLGQNPKNSGEIDYIANDSGFVKLHKFPEWSEFISSIKQILSQKESLQKKQSEQWVATITSNKINPNSKGKFNKARTGFALYYSKVDTLEVPYLVYIPQSYNPLKRSKAIVYLHGGIVNSESFNYQNPELGEGEPIFQFGDTYNSIIIYPFGKKDFGWVKQLAAFQNVLKIISEVQTTYNIDDKNIYLGGMSNGGSATFWFASQKINIFKGFYAFSADPKLEIGEINYANILKPFYSINAKDDDVFKFDEVKRIYEMNKTTAKSWNFDILLSGGHGFIYQQNGKDIMDTLFKKMIIDK